MDELELLLGDLQEHVKGGVRGLSTGLKAGYFPSIGPMTFVAGNVTSYGGEWINLQAMWFVPNAGFQVDSETCSARIAFERLSDKRLHVCPGVQVICMGERTVMHDCNAVTLKDARICFRPEHEPTLPWDEWDVIHMFCGAFGGWSQAIR